MTDITFYSRDDAGLLTRHVSSGWDSEADFAEHFGLGDFEAERETLVGWPDASVEWHGNIGIARP